MMPKPFLLPLLIVTSFLVVNHIAVAQLQISTNNVANQLAQKLVGEGVVISNATITTSPIATGFFRNVGGTSLGMDSGIVLTNGRAKTIGGGAGSIGLDWPGVTPANARLASTSLGLPGDLDLANELHVPLIEVNDAIALQFDFIPLGDSISFNYVLSSEEYDPQYVCVFNDAFAFFISGPGITGMKNIALVPGSNMPVSIRNINNVVSAGCVNNPQYYIDNTSNVFFTHDGHTTVLTASAAVQPCQTYHLKLVVADQGPNQDRVWDTGVFLEAGSLRSEPVKFDPYTPLNELHLPYLAEGCVSGELHVVRSRKRPVAQTLNLSYGGDAINGVDVLALPNSITIPANDSVAVLPITAIADFIPEGHETLKIYIGNSCASFYSDSINIELRDVDILNISPADSTTICRNNSVQLNAAGGYLNYSWTNGSTLSGDQINNPIASPTAAPTSYICTATIGDCIAQDSVLIKWRTISLVGKTDIACANGNTGAITVSGNGWTNPTYAINGGPFQASGNFSNLPAGNYWVKMKDASGCVDSIQVTLVQSFPDLSLTANTTAATCSLTPDGLIQVTGIGGNGNYAFSTTGSSYQANNSLSVAEGTYTVYIKDGNGCIATQPNVIVGKVNTVVVDAEPGRYICQGTSYTITATSNATNISWTPASTLTNANTLTPTASPADSTTYYVTATFGTCTRTDSITLNVWKAPVPDAGDNQDICYGITAQLNGSGGVDYQWTTNPTFISRTDINDPVVKPLITSIYYLNVKDAHGCQSLQPDAVTIKVTPSVKIFAGNDTVIAMNQPLQLRALDMNNSGITIWQWSGATFLDNPLIATPVARFSSPVLSSPFEYTYTVTGKTPAGCEGSDEVKIKVYQGPAIYVPTGFTPNGDGKNDLLIPLPVGLKSLKFFRIFNRWGQVIFSTTTLNKGWDGKIMGIDQPAGVFIWEAEGIDYTGKSISGRGTITLIR